MKKFLFAALAILATAGTVSAADVAVRPAGSPAAMIAAPYNWSGLYLGIEGGLGSGRSHHSTALVPNFSDVFGVSGGLFGATAGMNWQTGALVLGVEGDASFAWMSGSTAGIAPIFCPPGGATANCTTRLQGLETLRLRVGYAWDRFMPYATGGLAVGQIYGASDPGNVNSGSASKAGWTFGGGIEGAFGQNWTAKLEYLYVDFGTASGLFIRNPGAFPFNVSLNAHIFRVGLNYKFGAWY